MPRLYDGEVIFASRRTCTVTLAEHATASSSASAGIWFSRSRPAASPWSFSGSGTVYLTNYRLVFVAQKPTPEFQSVELPLLYIEEFDVSQPIFGANALHGTCRKVDGSGTTPPLVKWKVAFMAGGMSTMVPLFYQTVAYIRTAARRRGEPAAQAKRVPIQREIPDFVAHAVVDPNDPTVVYVVAEQQPEQDDQGDQGDQGGRLREQPRFDTLYSKKTN